jgi:hypothetical protein
MPPACRIQPSLPSPPRRRAPGGREPPNLLALRGGPRRAEAGPLPAGRVLAVHVGTGRPARPAASGKGAGACGLGRAGPHTPQPKPSAPPTPRGRRLTTATPPAAAAAARRSGPAAVQRQAGALQAAGGPAAPQRNGGSRRRRRCCWCCCCNAAVARAFLQRTLHAGVFCLASTALPCTGSGRRRALATRPRPRSGAAAALPTSRAALSPGTTRPPWRPRSRRLPPRSPRPAPWSCTRLTTSTTRSGRARQVGPRQRCCGDSAGV